MPRKTDARAHAIAAAERLFRIQGYTATGLTQILETSGAPKGSFYFHFPRGKAQLAEETIDHYIAKRIAVLRDISQSFAPLAQARKAQKAPEPSAAQLRSAGLCVPNVPVVPQTPRTGVSKVQLNGLVVAAQPAAEPPVQDQGTADDVEFTDASDGKGNEGDGAPENKKLRGRKP